MSFPSRVLTSYNTSLLKSPTLTNFITGSTLAVTGDLGCQRWLEGKEDIEWRRCLSLFLFGGFYSGGICVRLYKLYSHITPPKLSMWKKGMWASAIDNGVHVPVFYTPVFYLGTDWVKGVEWEESLDGYV
ncbi:hypothetical protein TrVE_jg13129 [Triparma verrucosa]|uniref:Uncharacterized protein n=1 Tax=Triparma verrucosa TaxID=1606542 RepID=A0A9W7CKT8_9STRA|nr:hypothetical protein TrVE_jg13129 [Triparma verrucosa]